MGCFLIEITIGAPVNDTLKEKVEISLFIANFVWMEFGADHVCQFKWLAVFWLKLFIIISKTKLVTPTFL